MWTPAGFAQTVTNTPIWLTSFFCFCTRSGATQFSTGSATGVLTNHHTLLITLYTTKIIIFLTAHHKCLIFVIFSNTIIVKRYTYTHKYINKLFLLAYKLWLHVVRLHAYVKAWFKFSSEFKWKQTYMIILYIAYPWWKRVTKKFRSCSLDHQSKENSQINVKSQFNENTNLFFNNIGTTSIFLWSD